MMRNYLRVLLASALAAILAFGSVSAQDLRPVDPLAKAGYFVTQTSTGADYVVAFNFVQNGDIYMHMSVNTDRSWVGVGIGDNMAGAFMLIAYKSESGYGVTTSARFAHGNSEPQLLEDAVVEKIQNDAYGPNSNAAKTGGIMISHIVCRNCSRYATNLDYTSKTQPFIFAVGPTKHLDDDSLDAPLREHEFYGKFTLDMTLATTPLDFSEGADYGRVPAPNVNGTAAIAADSTFTSYGSSLPFDDHKDSDHVVIAHGVVMGIAFILVFPIGALLLRLLHSVLWHSVAQGLGVVLVIAGFGSGVYCSTLYNRSRNFQSAHQAIGLLIFAGVLIQVGLGLANHLIFRRTKSPTAWGKIHMILGPSIMLLAIINGGLGLDLAGDHIVRIPYAIVVLILAVLFIFARTWLYIFHRHTQYQPDEETVAYYHKRRSYAAAPPDHPNSGSSSLGIIQHTEVPIPEAYHEDQPPASAISKHFAFEMSTPVTVAPPTPRWPAPSMPQRTFSSASRASSGAVSEHESFIGQDKVVEWGGQA